MNLKNKLMLGLLWGSLLGSSHVLAVTPPNDEIGAAIPIRANMPFVVGTTIDAHIDDTNQFESICNLPIDSPGVWYVVSGSGREITAKTCDDSDVYTPFDTKLSVFTMSETGALSCQVANDDFCGLQSEVKWDSVENEKYYILVHGFNATGDFRLFVNGQGDFAPGERVFTTDIPVLGLPALALLSTVLAGCGVWFSRKRTG